MERVNIINEIIDSRSLSDEDYIVINSLIQALNPKEACSLLDLTFIQPKRIREYTLKKISNDISKTYRQPHKKLISTLISRLEDKKHTKKDRYSYCLNSLYESVPKKVKGDILSSFLNSNSIRNRNRFFKISLLTWNPKYLEIIEQLWYTYHDHYCLEIILKYFPDTFILENYKELIEYSQPYQIKDIFLKLGSIDFQLVAELKDIDEITYCYVLLKLGKKISNDEANIFLKNNYMDERLGLLLWVFGQMNLWDRIIEYDTKYLDKRKKQYHFDDGF